MLGSATGSISYLFYLNFTLESQYTTISPTVGKGKSPMFSEALQIVTKYTLPVIFSRRFRRGQISSSMGTFVVVNPEGWILTADHIAAEILKLASKPFRSTSGRSEQSRKTPRFEIRTKNA